MGERWRTAPLCVYKSRQSFGLTDQREETIMRNLISAALLAASIATGSSAMAQTRTLEVIVFAGASAMPIYVAQEKGFFAKEGLTVNVTATPSSGFQMSNLINGKFCLISELFAFDHLLRPHASSPKCGLNVPARHAAQAEFPRRRC
jgi:hypothetical protein